MTEALDPMAATEVDQKQLAALLLAQAKEQGVCGAPAVLGAGGVFGFGGVGEWCRVGRGVARPVLGWF